MRARGFLWVIEVTTCVCTAGHRLFYTDFQALARIQKVIFLAEAAFVDCKNCKCQGLLQLKSIFHPFEF